MEGEWREVDGSVGGELIGSLALSRAVLWQAVWLSRAFFSLFFGRQEGLIGVPLGGVAAPPLKSSPQCRVAPKREASACSKGTTRFLLLLGFVFSL